MTGESHPFLIHERFGISQVRARDLERALTVEIKKQSMTLPRLINFARTVKSVSSIKSLSVSERQYLMVLLGIFIHRNEQAHRLRLDKQSHKGGNPLIPGDWTGDADGEYGDEEDGSEAG